MTKGLNFKILITQLTDEFKIKVVNKQIKLSEVFKISNKGEEMLLNMIEAENPIKHKSFWNRLFDGPIKY